MAGKSRWANVGAVLAVLAGVMLFSGVFCGPAMAQEQWLGYRSATSAYGHIGSTSGQKFCPQGMAPAGVALPAFNDKEPLFALWKVDIGKLTGPAARDGGLWLALDRSGKGRLSGLYDLLYIDANGNGSLADEKPIRASHVFFDWHFEGSPVGGSFNMVRIVLAGDDGPITYHAGVDYQRKAGKPYELRVECTGWYEGQVVIGGRKFTCSVIDNNANGRFGERSAKPDQCDRLILRPYSPGMGPQEQVDVASAPIGRYVLVEGKYYSMETAPDGATVKFTAAKVPTGTIRPGEGVTSLKVAGPAGTFEIDVRDGVVEVPEDEYVVLSYSITRKDGKGNTWCVREANPFKDKPLAVRAGSETKIEVGEPFAWFVSASSAEQGLYRISQGLRTLRGDDVRLTCNGDRLPVKVRITNADKTYDRTFSMEYG